MKGLIPVLPRAGWIVLTGDLLAAIGSGLTLPFFIVYLHHVRGIGLGPAGLILATTAVAAFAGNPTSGVLIDRVGPRRTVLVGLVIAAVGTGAIAFVTSPAEAFLAAGVSGFGVAVVFPSFDALLAVAVRPEQRSSAFAVRHATLNLGFGVGSLIAAAIVDFHSVASFQALYLLDGASFLAFVPLLIVLRGVGDAPEEQTVEAGAYAAVLRDRAFLRVIGITALLITVGFAQLNSALPAFATRPGGISAGELGIVAAVNSFVVVALTLPVLREARGSRRTAALMLAFALWAASWAVALVAGHLGSGPAAVVFFAGATAIFGLGETLVSPSLGPLVNDLAPDRLRGRYNAVNTLALTTGFMLGPIIAGAALAAGHATALFLGLMVACGVGALGALRLRPHLPQGIDLIGDVSGE